MATISTTTPAEATFNRLSTAEAFLLKWLSKEDSSSYGECKGADMDRLVQLGIAELGPIPDGRTEEFRRCWLSEYGWELITDGRDSDDRARDLDDMASD